MSLAEQQNVRLSHPDVPPVHAVQPLDYELPSTARRGRDWSLWIGVSAAFFLGMGSGWTVAGIMWLNRFRDEVTGSMGFGVGSLVFGAGLAALFWIRYKAPARAMRILGIDPGLQVTGYGVIDCASLRPTLVDGGLIRLKPKTPIADRLVELEIELDQLLDEFKPDVCAVEQLYSHYNHPRTAILMGHARGVIMLVAARRGARVEQYAANRIKQSLTGHGHASKQQMQRAIQSMWNLKQVPEPPDVADALAVALCCAQQSLNKSVRSTQSPRLGRGAS